MGCVLVGPAGTAAGGRSTGEAVLTHGHNLTNAARNGTRHAELVAVDAALGVTGASPIQGDSSLLLVPETSLAPECDDWRLLESMFLDFELPRGPFEQQAH